MEDTPLASLPLAFLDLETTGFSPPSRIWEVAACRVEGGRKEWLEALCDPGCPIPSRVQELCGVGAEVAAGAPPFAELLPDLRRLIEGAVVVAHNLPFEQRFLAAEGVTLGAGIDTLAVARRLYPRLPSHALGELARELGLPVSQAHRARGDVETLRGVWGRMVGDLAGCWVSTLGDLAYWSRGRKRFVP